MILGQADLDAAREVVHDRDQVQVPHVLAQSISCGCWRGKLSDRAASMSTGGNR